MLEDNTDIVIDFGFLMKRDDKKVHNYIRLGNKAIMKVTPVGSYERFLDPESKSKSYNYKIHSKSYIRTWTAISTGSLSQLNAVHTF